MRCVGVIEQSTMNLRCGLTVMRCMTARRHENAVGCVLVLFSLKPADSQLYSFFFNDTATTEIYTLSLHDALPISQDALYHWPDPGDCRDRCSLYHESKHRDPLDLHCAWRPRVRSPHWLEHSRVDRPERKDRKSTRLNSSHPSISYAVFCLKKKNKT